METAIRYLTSLSGVSGDEKKVCKALMERVLPLEGQIDALGNLSYDVKGKQPALQRLMISAHMDEVGFIITHITDDGYLKFSTVGGIDARVLPGKSVLIGENQLQGVIGSLAIHLQDTAQRKRAPKIENLYIDIGAKDKAMAEQYVTVGDYVTFDSPFRFLGSHRVKAKALDDRVGCYILSELMKEEQAVDYHAVFTTMEEIGCIGAAAAADAYKPDIAIILEGTTASDSGETPRDQQVCRLGEGLVLSFMDRGTIYDKSFLKLAIDTAKEQGIPVQLKEAVAGGNEASAVQKAGFGCSVLAISIPCRYIHSPASVMDLRDVAAAKKLVSALLQKLI